LPAPSVMISPRALVATLSSTPAPADADSEGAASDAEAEGAASDAEADGAATDGAVVALPPPLEQAAKIASVAKRPAASLPTRVYRVIASSPLLIGVQPPIRRG
jgi:hypothetical protein